MPVAKLSKVRKSHDLTNADFGNFSLSSYRAFLNITARMQKHDSDGNLIPLHLANRNCSLSAVEFAKAFGLQENHAYEILKSTVRKLLKTSFTLPVSAGLLEINVCAQALYVKRAGRIDIRFTEEIMPHLAAVSERFTMYNLCEVAGFASIYTTRFYELLMRWKTTGKLEIGVPELRHALGCTKIFTLYADFKRFGFGHAINEINSQYDIDIRFEEIKVGRAVSSLIITFKPTERHLAYDVVKQKYRTQLTRPKKIKPVKQEMPLTQNTANEELVTPKAPAQNLIVESPPLPNTETQNSVTQKKKRFFGLF